MKGQYGDTLESITVIIEKYAEWTSSRLPVSIQYGLWQIAKYHRFDALWDCKEDNLSHNASICPFLKPTMQSALSYFPISDKPCGVYRVVI